MMPMIQKGILGGAVQSGAPDVLIQEIQQAIQTQTPLSEEAKGLLAGLAMELDMDLPELVAQIIMEEMRG